jgi:hypothetical protein
MNRHQRFSQENFSPSSDLDSENKDSSAKSSPLSELLKVTSDYTSNKISSKDLSRILEKTYNDLEKLIEENPDVFDKFSEGSDEAQLIEDVFDIVCELDEAVMNQEPAEGILEITGIMEELNQKFSKTFKSVLNTNPLYTEEELVRSILDELTEEDLITSNYVRIEENSLKYLENQVSRKDFQMVLDEMKEIIQMTRSGYEESFISHNEWTMEVALGDKLFMDGLLEWEQALNFLTDCADSKNEEQITEGLDMLLEANKKLVMVQILAKKVSEQAEKMERMKRGQPI